MGGFTIERLDAGRDLRFGRLETSVDAFPAGCLIATSRRDGSCFGLNRRRRRRINRFSGPGNDRVAFGREAVHQLVDRPLPLNKRVDPVEVGEAHTKPPLGQDILDPEGNDNFAGIAGDRDFAPDIFAFVAPAGENQEHGPRSINRVGDLVIERPAGSHVTWGDPAGNATALQLGDDLQRSRAILTDMTDEQKEVWRGQKPPSLSRMPSTILSGLPNS
jgi:hypothetical protein